MPAAKESPTERRLWDALTRVAVIGLAAGVGFLTKMGLNNNDRLTRIEANRYTSADGARDREKTSQQIDQVERAVVDSKDELKVELGRVREKIDEAVSRRLEALEARLDKLGTDMAEVKAKVR